MTASGGLSYAVGNEEMAPMLSGSTIIKGQAT